MIDSIQGFGSMQGMQQMRPPQSLTDEQKTQVQDILSNYDAENITEEDAKEIFQAFKEAGIQGAGLKEAIEEAGFDAEDLRTKGMGEEGAPPPPPPPGGMGGSSGVDTEALQELQSILSQYDLASLTSEQQEELTSKLSEAGLLNSGNMIDIGA